MFELTNIHFWHFFKVSEYGILHTSERGLYNNYVDISGFVDICRIRLEGGQKIFFTLQFFAINPIVSGLTICCRLGL